MPELNPNVQSWIKALRSDKYQKTEGALRDYEQVWSPEKVTYVTSNKPQYCALGVAMLLAERAGVHITESQWEKGDLPSSVVDWLGVKRGNNAVKLNAVSIPELNDGSWSYDRKTTDEYGDPKEKSFKEIAEVIEEHPQVFGKIRWKAKKQAKNKAQKKAKNKKH